MRAWVGGAYRVVEADDGLTLTREHPPGRVEAAAGGWLIRDDERIYAVPPYVFRGHCCEMAVE